MSNIILEKLKELKIHHQLNLSKKKPKVKIYKNIHSISKGENNKYDYFDENEKMQENLTIEQLKEIIDNLQIKYFWFGAIDDLQAGSIYYVLKSENEKLTITEKKLKKQSYKNLIKGIMKSKKSKSEKLDIHKNKLKESLGGGNFSKIDII